MKVILCGFHWTGCRALDLLMDREDIEEIFVYTHSSQWYIPSLANYCQKKEIPYSLKDISKVELPFKPDLICSIYYRNLIKKHIIHACDGRIFNLHPSLLPKYRGTGSLTWAIINGEKETGYTYHLIDPNIDAGNILVQKKVPIFDYETQEVLYNRLMFESMKDFNLAIDLVLAGEKGIEQQGNSSYYSRGAPNDGLIDDAWPDDKIERFIRAMIYPPLPVAVYKGTSIKSFEEFNEIRNRTDC